MTKKERIKRIRILADTFLFLHEAQPEAEVDMVHVDFNVCGTVACHAGWFAIAQGKDRTRDYDFLSAADEMAQLLGFDSGYDLCKWASDNQEIWGNKHGALMFNHHLAFVDSPEKLNLKAIGEHWHGVADRLEVN
ncbi:MAG TPA: hypothetical protein VHA52_01050 [Candidatus Babeliaceae bacterium]|nr:hypothetical protein [Candidatus Babeliaceae bacterium]